MANWAKLQEDTIQLPIFKRAKHGIHFKNNDGSITANFSGKPCHYLDNGIYKPIDTKPILLPNGSYGCPHSPLRIYSDGVVSILGTDYAQRARLFSAGNVKLDGDRLVRAFNGGEQSLYITEDGFRSEIRLDRKPNLLQAAYLLASVTGNLPSGYIQRPTVMTDADGKVYTYGTAANFRAWLDAAVYPVVIDPDFAGGSSDAFILGTNATYATARSTSWGVTQNKLGVGQYGTPYEVYRSFVKFDTSSIGAGTVNQCNLKLVCTVDVSNTAEFDVQIVKQDWSGQDPIATGNKEAAYDGCLSGTADDAIWRNTSGMSTNTQYTSGNLSTAWVNKIGTTYYSLRSSRDYAATAPSGFERIDLGASENATEGYRPVLTVLYTTGIAVPIAQYYYNQLRRNK